jgi:hypothetical protein|tara:strand:- start:50 stop:505 length:456 start_codon:yes stop_codon:yes gene_type:complete
MPITKKKDGYYWGSKGPFKTRKKAVQVAQAAYASGYVKKTWQHILKKDPKKGTGKKPKGSARRLYTDENPKDTVSVKFRTAKDVRDTFSSASFKSKPHKRQSQIINLVEQRARVAAKRAKDPEAKKRLNAAHKVALARKESSKRKTKRMKR